MKKVRKVLPVQMIPVDALKPSLWNPRKISNKELKKLAKNILLYGFLENVVARSETNELVSGHQRVLAYKLLLDPDGPFANHRKIKSLSKEIPVIQIEGLSQKAAKALAISMNKIQGKWDIEKLGTALADIYPDLDKFDDDVYSTGFELAEYEKMLGRLEDHIQPDDLKRVPKLTLEFSDKEFRDSVKQLLSAENEIEEALSGDILYRLLESRIKASSRTT